MHRTKLEKAVGKLISAIQKEWGNELGESTADTSEHVINLAHELLQAGSADSIVEKLGSRSIKQYLGGLWVMRHPSVHQAIANLEDALKNEQAVNQTKYSKTQ